MRHLLLSFSLLATGLCIAAPLSPEEALDRLDSGLLPATRSAASLRPAMTLSTPVGEPALYVFNTNGGSGFMVVSADDAVPALLGYSDLNSFDLDNLPPAFQNWLDQYTDQIDFVRSHSELKTRGEELSTRASLPNWSAISPKVKTRWNQDAPFNNDCPLQNNRRTYTGCVATSMAQVMNYFQYPEKGQGSISYRVNYGTAMAPNYVTYSKDFSTITFDWANMLNSYTGKYTTEQADAVATLMSAAGYSVLMSYTTDVSGAVSGYIPGALVNYFNYDSSAQYISRNMVGYTEWATLIYNNLKNVGPVIYDGDSPSEGGHSFVCDGYDGNGYFHFNWGWGGVADGYFLLDSLEPLTTGIGGSYGGFNFNQDAVFNIQPPKAGTQAAPSDIYLNGSVSGGLFSTGSYLALQITGSQLPGYRYYGHDAMTFDVGLKFVPADNESAQPIYVKASNASSFRRDFMPLDPGYVLYCSGKDGYAYPLFTISNLGISDNVKYKATAVYLPDGTENWLEVGVDKGSYNYFYVTKSGTSFDFDNLDQMQFTCDNLELASELYYTKAAQVKLSLTNENDIQLSRGVTFVLLDSYDNIIFMADDSLLETLDPGQTLELDITTLLTQQSQSSLSMPAQYYMALLDIDTQTFYYKSDEPVTMQKNPGDATVEASITLANGQYDANEDMWTVENAQDIQAVAEISVTEGIYASQTNLYIVETSSGRGAVMQTYPLEIRVLNEGESTTYNVPVNFSGAVVGDYYVMILDIKGDYNVADEPYLYFTATTNEAGVESLFAAGSEIKMAYDKAAGKLLLLGGEGGVKAAEVYSLNGMKLAASSEKLGDHLIIDLSSLGKGIVLVTATDGTGHTKTFKLAL